jgi:PAS domain S-box-containing protein
LDLVRTSEQRFRAALQIRAIGAIFFDMDGRLLDANDAFLAMSGYTREDLASGSLTWQQLTPPEWMTASESAFAELKAMGETTPYEKEYFRKDGTRWWALFAAKRMPDGTGFEYVVDITARKEAEDRLRGSEERLRLIVESVRDYAIFVTDVDGRIIDWMPGAAAVFGWKAEEVMGQSAAILYTPADRAAGVPEEEIEIARRAGVAPNVRWHMRKDGSAVFMEGSVIALRDTHGALHGFLKIAQDVTARERSEAARRESEARHRALFEQAAVGVTTADLTGRWTSVNRRLAEILGYDDPRELVGRSYVEVTHPEDLGHDVPLLRALDAGEIPHFQRDKRYVRKNGEPIWVNVTISLVRDPHSGVPRHRVAVIQDIGERKRAEQRSALLAREVDHRSKNMLAVLQAMVRMTRADNVSEYVASIQGRIAALARVHTLLSASRWEGADLEELVNDELAPYRKGPRVRIEGPPLALTPLAAQSFALVVHELATNAAKYGALSNRDGHVTVTWRVESDRRLVLCWQESGGPPVRGPTRRGLGMGVIERTARDQLEGVARFTWRPEGLVCEVCVPASTMAQAQP